MAISFSCKGCGASGVVPDSAAGMKGTCEKCGATVLVGGVPAKAGVQKVCVMCGTDVAGKKRTKDTAGSYYCQPCWQSKLAVIREAPQLAAVGANHNSLAELGAREAQGVELVNDPAEDLGVLVCCPACGMDVPAPEMTTDDFGEPLCGTCHRERNAPLELVDAPAALPSLPPPLPTPTRVAPMAARVPPKTRTSVTMSGSGSGGMGLMAVGALMAGGGATASIVGYHAATHGSNGGRYYVFTGLIISGIITFFRGLAKRRAGDRGGGLWLPLRVLVSLPGCNSGSWSR